MKLSHNKIFQELGNDGLDQLFIGKPAAQWVAEGKEKPAPVSLWQNIWHRGELACVFSDSNVGKTLLAMEIGIDLVKQGQTVAYFDFEMTDVHLAARYGTLPEIPAGFMRYEMNTNIIAPYGHREDELEELIIGAIEGKAFEISADVVMIDNLGAICNGNQEGEKATRLMRRLKKLKEDWGWSILVIGHTRKRDFDGPITQNELGGSKRLFNFFDEVFALNKSVRGEAQRYVKQLKVRVDFVHYGQDSVLDCHIEADEHGAPHFVYHSETSQEYDHLPKKRQYTNVSASGRTELIEEAKRLSAEGLSIRAIAEELQVSKSSVHGWLKAPTAE